MTRYQILPVMTVSVLLALAVSLSHNARAADLQVRVVSPDGNPVQHAVVEMLTDVGAAVPAPTPNAVMDQINREFVGPVLAITVNTLVDFPNSDNVHHHVYSFSATKRFELPLYTGNTAEPVKFESPGVVTLGCNIHDWMVGYIYVARTHHFALTDGNGIAVLPGLSAGEHQLTVWHSSLPANVELPEYNVTVNSQGAELELTLDTQTMRSIRRSPIPGRRAY